MSENRDFSGSPGSIAHHLPTIREFRLEALAGDADVECISLLSQVMNEYPDIDHDLISKWFSEKYIGIDTIRERLRDNG